ncbi:unnamed protein product, partial [Rotaria sp. Silwood1]
DRSASHADVTEYNNQLIRQGPITVPKRAGSLMDMDCCRYSSPFNIADFIQSKFHPMFTANGKKLTLKVDTRGYEPDELTVRLLDDNLLVQGRKKTSSIKHNENKQLNESIRLPYGINRYNVTSQVIDDGMLLIEIPLMNSSMYR